MRGPLESLAPGPRRLLVAGAAGAGKTSLARCIEAVAGLPYTDIDCLSRPGWTVQPNFAAADEAFTAEDRWITEWKCTTQLGDLLPSRADTLVWLDLPPSLHKARLLSRTLMRRLRRTELWNGNVEPPLHTIFRDPKHIDRWGFSGRDKIRKRVIRVEADLPHLRAVRLRSQCDVEEWLQTLSSSSEY